MSSFGVSALGDAPADAWPKVIFWARRFYERPDFGPEERDYKEKIANRLHAARRAIEARDTDWYDKLRRAFTSSPNNLTPWQVHDPFLKWVKANPENALSSLELAWDTVSPVEERIDGFLDGVPPKVMTGPGRRLAVAAFLQAAVDEHGLPIYRPVPVRAAYQLMGYPEEPTQASPGVRYLHFLAFLDVFIREAAANGLTIADRRDAQSLAWTIIKYDPPADWSQADQDAFVRFRAGGKVAAGPLPRRNLQDVVERFRDDSQYPTEDDERQIQQRTELAQALARDALENPDVTQLRRFAAAAYSSPGPHPGFMRLLNSEEGPQQAANALAYLLYADGEIAQRMDEILSGSRQVYGMKESLLTKALSIVDASTWIPVFIARGTLGKLRMLERLGIPHPTASTQGQLAVATNHSLYEALTPYFEDDTYGMKQFLYWLLRQEREAAPEETLTAVAERLHLDVIYLQEVERLLEDKRQIIFYGPPGTGKTYAAQKLGRFFARTGAFEIIQFHPSYSYEDFVEGYRPTLVKDQPSFQLVDGPLKRLAARAENDPAGRYVLLIDEINRGNIAKILGELYFLLEYRNEEIQLQYSNEPFRLPTNLWIIGTMNSADRSIALVDAALRRRFYFEPFIPNEPPIEGLLRRWLEAERPSMLWIADVVDRANQLLGDNNIAIGPSYFLRADLDDEWVDLIWRRSILPFLSEQFMGQGDRIKEFDLGRLRQPDSVEQAGGDNAAAANLSA